MRSHAAQQRHRRTSEVGPRHRALLRGGRHPPPATTGDAAAPQQLARQRSVLFRGGGRGDGMPSCSRGAERVRHTTDTIYEDGNFRVSKVAGKGYGMLAARRFEAGALVLQVRYAGECVRVRRAPQGVMRLSTFSCARASVQETPFARVNKDTHVIASTNAAAAELLQRVHRIAATGTFDPSDQR